MTTHNTSRPIPGCISTLDRLLSMCAKNPVAQKIFVPSLFIFLSVSAAILLACAHAVGAPAGACGAVILFLALLSAPIVYGNALRIGAGGGLSRLKGGVTRAVLLLVIAVSCSVYITARINGLLARGAPALGRGEWVAHVESVVSRRYYREAVVRFRCRGSAGNWRGGAVRATSGSFGTGDTIGFAGKPVPLGDGGPSCAILSKRLKGVQYVCYPDGGRVAVIDDAVSFREDARNRLAANCDSLFGRKTAAMVKALYFGNQDFIDKLTMQDFKRAGVFHILSAGGLHVAVVAAVPIFLLGLVRVNRKVITAVALLAVTAYLWITDMPVSLLRSCVMFFMYTVQRIADRESNIFNALFLSAAVILVLFPGEMFGLGFQLSYGATLGILLFHGRYRKTLSWLPAALSNPVALTLSAQLLVLPVLLVRMNELNLAGLASNIIVVPLMSLLLIVSLAANAVSFVPVAAAWAGSLTDAVYCLADSIVRFMSGLNGHFYIAAPGPFLAVALVLLVAPLIPPLRRKRMVSLSIPAAVLAAWLSLGGAGAAGRDTVTEVRHSRGALLLVKNGATLSVIGRYPEKRHAERLLREIAAASCRDVVLHLPHADYEDVSGCSQLARRLPVSRCYLTGDFRLRGFIRRFFALLDRDGVDLVMHDCGRPGPEEEACRLYRQVSSRVGAPSRSGNVKKTVRFLTLH